MVAASQMWRPFDCCLANWPASLKADAASAAGDAAEVSGGSGAAAAATAAALAALTATLPLPAAVRGANVA